jgi:hypothetical protein
MSASDTQRVKRYTTGPLPLCDAKSRADRLEALLAQHQRAGGRDMTVKELCRAYNGAQFRHEVTGDLLELYPNTCEAGMSSLEAAQRVECDRENKRHCTVTGVEVKVYRLKARQVEIV